MWVDLKLPNAVNGLKVESTGTLKILLVAELCKDHVMLRMLHVEIKYYFFC